MALFRLREGGFTFYDVAMRPRPGKVQLDNTLTIVRGRKLERLDERPLHPWASIPAAQRSVGARPSRPLRLAGFTRFYTALYIFDARFSARC